MLSSDPPAIEFENQIAEHALQLFRMVQGLTWADSYAVALYIRERGQIQAAQALYLISQTGCSFAQARVMIEQVDE